MAKKSGLGNIFDDLFMDDINDINSVGEDSGGGRSVTQMKLTEIEPNREQPRKDFDKEKLEILAESISMHGVISPIIVRPFGERYQIVAGERRWRASRMAGLSEVPVRIVELSDLETMQIALIENLQREDLNPIEEAMGYRELIESFDMKQEDVAKRVGKARSSVTNSLRLLTMPDEVIELVRNGEISRGHCKVLMAADSDSKMIELANKVKNDGLSVRTLEKFVKAASEKSESGEKKKKDTFFIEAELSLFELLGKQVRINSGKNKITIQVDVDSENELKAIVNKLGEVKF